MGGGGVRPGVVCSQVSTLSLWSKEDTGKTALSLYDAEVQKGKTNTYLDFKAKTVVVFVSCFTKDH